MILRSLTFVALSFAVSAVALKARAADLIEPPPPQFEPAPEFSGWYLRGDVDYQFRSKASGDYAFWNQFVGATGVDDVFDDRIETDKAFGGGVGVGYRFSEHLRGDLTLDYSKADLDGSVSCISYVTASLGLDFYNDCRERKSGDVKMWTGLANAYADLVRLGPVTPYIGAGLGFAYVDYGNIRKEEDCGSDPACVGYTNYVGEHEGEASWRFASSLTAGASVDVTDQLKFDAGYRYTHIAGGDAYGYDDADKSFGASGVQGRDDGFDVHTVRAGLRYEFGSGYAGGDPVYK